MTTLADLRLRAQRRADMEDSTFISTTEWTDYINQGMNELYDLLISAYEDYFTTSTTLTINSGANTVSLPATFYKLRGLDYQVDSNTWRTLRWFQFNDRNVGSNRSSWGRDRSYQIIGDTIEVVPENVASGTYRLWYAPGPTQLSADGDSIPTAMSKFGWDEYIALYAAERALVKEESDVQMILVAKEALRSRIMKMSANRQIDQSETVQDVQGVTWLRGWNDQGF